MTTTIKRHCECGGSITVTVDNARADVARTVVTIFTSEHTGPGHAPTDARGAANGRRRAERRAEAEQRRERAL